MRHLLNITDMTIEETDALLALGEDIFLHPERYAQRMAGKKLATLFFEPSTRTRLSFEAAMYELGGQVLGFAGAASSSAAKGETVGDTVRTVSCYADLIAMRHPLEGAAFAAVQASLVPIINAGDGGHYHPTQTLADLMTIKREKGRLDHLRIGLCGDLKFGRTVHSLLSALSRYEGIEFVCISPRELRLPASALRHLDEAGLVYRESVSLEEEIGQLDVLYMTRVQRERFSCEEEYQRLKDSYILDPEKMALAQSKMIVLHPLPRVNEIDHRVDADPRACYFKQVNYGKIMRKALLLTLDAQRNGASAPLPGVPCSHLQCSNPRCITHHEAQLVPLFYPLEDGKGAHACAYCDTKAE